MLWGCKGVGGVLLLFGGCSASRYSSCSQRVKPPGRLRCWRYSPGSVPVTGRQRLCHVPPHSFGVLLGFLLTRQLSERRGKWRLPRAPEECPQVCSAMLPCRCQQRYVNQ